MFILSNSHVLALDGLAAEATTSYNRGPRHRGASGTIAKLADWVPFQFETTCWPNLVDAASLAYPPKKVKRGHRRDQRPSRCDELSNHGRDGCKKLGRSSDLVSGHVIQTSTNMKWEHMKTLSNSSAKCGTPTRFGVASLAYRVTAAPSFSQPPEQSRWITCCGSDSTAVQQDLYVFSGVANQDRLDSRTVSLAAGERRQDEPSHAHAAGSSSSESRRSRRAETRILNDPSALAAAARNGHCVKAAAVRDGKRRYTALRGRISTRTRGGCLPPLTLRVARPTPALKNTCTSRSSHQSNNPWVLAPGRSRRRRASVGARRRLLAIVLFVAERP